MGKFITIGERLSTTAPAVNKAFLERDPSRSSQEQSSSWMPALPIWMLTSDRQKAMALN
ncbi:MAG: hypothetical protein V8S32_03110 [Lachnospiraceae bacterium]